MRYFNSLFKIVFSLIQYIHSFPSLYSSQLPATSPFLQIHLFSSSIQKRAGLQETMIKHGKKDPIRQGKGPQIEVVKGNLIEWKESKEQAKCQRNIFCFRLLPFIFSPHTYLIPPVLGPKCTNLPAISIFYPFQGAPHISLPRDLLFT